MLVVSALAASGAAWVTATRMPLVVAAQVADPAAAFTQVVITQALGTALLLLPMTLALGATFPLALAVAGGGASTVGRDAARVYTANTIGAIAGALAAGFVLVRARPAPDVPDRRDHRRARRRRVPGARAARTSENSELKTKTDEERRTPTTNSDRRVARRDRRRFRRGDPVAAGLGPRAAGERRLQVRAVSRHRRISTPCCAPARSSTTRRARRRRSACGG